MKRYIISVQIPKVIGNSKEALDKIKTESYFSELPPHLVNRFFFDPNRGKKGQLVLQGVFVDEVIGDDFIFKCF